MPRHTAVIVLRWDVFRLNDPEDWEDTLMPKIAFLELRDELEASHSMAAIKSAVSRFANRLGYQWFAHLSAYGSEVETASNYPKPWQILYHLHGFAELDPVVMAAINADCVFSWDGETFALDASEEQKAFLDAALGYGICSGTSIPVFGGFGRTSLLTLASPNLRGFCILESPILAANIATLVDVHTKRCRFDEPPVHAVKLTTRENTCLTWAARGNKVAQTATILGTAERTVEFHLRNAKRKLHAENTTHAVALAVRQQII